MNYTREQEIAEGLQRGELLFRLECGCVVIQDRTADAYIVYCPLHKAAPELYEACVTMDAFIENWLDVLLTNMTCEELHQKHDIVKQAIVKVKGGS